VYDKEASLLEEQEKVPINPELEGISREEMGLEPFKCTEIRSSLMGILVYISEEIIVVVLGLEAKGKYSGIDIPNPKKSP